MQNKKNMNLIIATLLVVVVNMPFGYWRGTVQKFSWQWFLAIHFPVLLVVGIRYLFHLGFAAYTYPLLVVAFFIGQLLGKIISRKRAKHVETGLSGNIILDFMRK